MSKENPKELMNAQKLMRAGLLGTKLYLVLLFTALPSMAMMGWIKISPLELNQVGDFLAGLFGPLAIFWIVLGFFQQGEELRNSVETLKLQAKELAASVEQQRELVQVTREQLAHEREMLGIQLSDRKKLAQPDFIVSFRKHVGSGDGKGKYRCTIVNSGNPVSRVNLTIKKNDEIIADRGWPFCGKGWADEGIDAFGGQFIPEISEPLVASIKYFDSENGHWVALYDLTPGDPAVDAWNFRTSFRQVVQISGELS